MRRFRVKNLDEYQHYRDRCPPWIKLHAKVLEDYEFGCLQDASKMHLVFIWLLASRHDNDLPWDEKWIERRISATESVDLQALHEAGFIEEIQSDKVMEHNASVPLASSKQNATLENRGQRTDSVPDGTGAAAPPDPPPKAIDPAKPCYDIGKPLLAKYGLSAHKAGGLITKWLKEYPPDQVLNVLQHAGTMERADIVAFVTGCLRDPFALPDFLKRGNDETNQTGPEGRSGRVARAVAAIEGPGRQDVAGAGGNADPALPAVSGE